MQKRQPGQHREVGSALILAMLILLVLTVIGISGANQSILQERMASNKNMQTKAFFMSELGLEMARAVVTSDDFYDGIDFADSEEASKSITGSFVNVAANPDNGIQLDSWQTIRRSEGEFFVHVPDGDDVNPSANGGYELRIVSDGRVPAGSSQASVRTTEMVVRIFPGSGGSDVPNPFPDGIVGIDGVGLRGSGRIDSFNSNYGSYGATITQGGDTFINRYTGQESDQFGGANTRTCQTGADITLSGDSPISGDVTSTGSIFMTGSSRISGDVHAENDVFLSGGSEIKGDVLVGRNFSTSGSPPVHGSVLVGGDLHSGGELLGAVTVAGNAEFTNSSYTTEHVIAGGDVNVGGTANEPPTIDAGGDISIPNWWQWDAAKPEVGEEYQPNLDAGQLNIPAVPPVPADDDIDCAPLGDLSEMFDETRADPNIMALGDWFDDHGCSHCYAIRGQGFVLTGGSGNQDASDTVIGTDGEATVLKVDNDITTGGRLQDLSVRGHVTLVVNGGFDLGGNTQLTVHPDATLTLMVEGTTRLGGGANLKAGDQFVREGPDGGLRPAVLLYSGYEEVGGTPNSAGVTVSGSHDAHIAIYAPKTDVVVTGSGDLFGSVVAYEIDARGAGGIHYDEALREMGDGIGDGDGDGEEGGVTPVNWRQAR